MQVHRRRQDSFVDDGQKRYQRKRRYPYEVMREQQFDVAILGMLHRELIWAIRRMKDGKIKELNEIAKNWGWVDVDNTPTPQSDSKVGEK